MAVRISISPPGGGESEEDDVVATDAVKAPGGGEWFTIWSASQ